MKYFDHSVTQPGLVAQLVERRCSNPEVVGTNPKSDFSLFGLENWFVTRRLAMRTGLVSHSLLRLGN